MSIPLSKSSPNRIYQRAFLPGNAICIQWQHLALLPNQFSSQFPQVYQPRHSFQLQPIILCQLLAQETIEIPIRMIFFMELIDSLKEVINVIVQNTVDVISNRFVSFMYRINIELQLPVMDTSTFNYELCMLCDERIQKGK